MSFGVKERVRQNYSENYFDVGIIAVEISRAGPTTTVFFSRILDIGGAFAACSTVNKWGCTKYHVRAQDI